MDMLDVIDRRLLDALGADPRASVAELARRVGRSAPVIRERLAKLEQTGVIRGYRVEIDPAAIGLPVAAWVRLRPGPGQLTKLADLARATPQVSECHRISGEDCFLLKLHAPSIAALGDLLDRFLLHSQTVSSIIVSTPVPPRTPSATPARPLTAD